MKDDLLASRPYSEALEFAPAACTYRNKPLHFPSYSDYVRLVARKVSTSTSRPSTRTCRISRNSRKHTSWPTSRPRLERLREHIWPRKAWMLRAL